jgi:hypothetical protein
MANVVDIQTIMDGPRNAVIKVDMTLDTSNLSGQVLYDPSAGYIDPISATTTVRIDEIQYAVQDGLVVQLLWDASVPKTIVHLDGRGKFPLDTLSGIPNNAGAGKTGKLLCSTSGWATSAILSATMIISLVKTV